MVHVNDCGNQFVNCMTGFISGEADVVGRWQWQRSGTGGSCGLSAGSDEKISQFLNVVSPLFTLVATQLVSVASTSATAARDIEYLALASSPLAVSCLFITDPFRRCNLIFFSAGIFYVCLPRVNECNARSFCCKDFTERIT